MKKIKIYVYKNNIEASHAIAMDIIKKVKANKKTILGTATGRTFIETYKYLVKDYSASNTNYEDVLLLGLDEYLNCKQTDEYSFYNLMNHDLFKHINLNRKHIYFPPNENVTDEKLRKYDEFFFKNIPDIQLIGIGLNGHIAFNEPPANIDSVTRIIDIEKSTIIQNSKIWFNGDESKMPHQATTIGVKNIMACKKIIVALYKKEKADVLEKFAKNKNISNDLPFSFLKKHPNLVIYADKECFLNVAKIDSELFEVIKI